MLSKKDGFSLLEVLVALSVFSFGLLAVATMQVSAIRGNHASATLTEAGALAADLMEKLLSLDYDHADMLDTNGDGTDQDVDNNGIDDDEEGDTVDGIANFGLDKTGAAADGTLTANDIYTLSWNVGIDVVTNNTKLVHIIVTWGERGSTRTLTLDGIKAR